MKTITFKIKKVFLLTIFSITFILNSFCEKTNIDGLYRYSFDNGLELFVAENHSVPLAYIELAVRTGAIDQTKETAGLFHLYEHMMFKGNALYKDAASITKALADLGVTSHNGTTSTDCVNYFFTIPSAKLEEGLAFWNAAVRTLSIDEKEFENEKKVVLSEIEGDKANPSFVLHYYSNLLMFNKEPFKTDPRGSFEVVRNATIAQLRNIQKEFYIPSNSAIFVGGDVDPDETYEFVKKIYGTWKNSLDENFVKNHEKTENEKIKNTLDETKFIVMPFDRISPELAEIDITWRAPDLDYDYEEAINAIYFDYVIGKPNSILKTKLCEKKEYKIPDPTYIGSYLSLGRKNSTMGCYALLKEPQENLAERTKNIFSYVNDSLYPEVVSTKTEFTSKQIKDFKVVQEDALIRASETADSLVIFARNCWINGEIEYLLENKKQNSIKQSSVKNFVSNYVTSKNAIVKVLVNPIVYEKIRSEFLDASFYELTSNEKLWWQKPEFSIDTNSFPKKSNYEIEKEIYVPEKNISKNNEMTQKRNTEIVELKNGIKVYIHQTNSKMNAIAIGCLGGYEKYPKELSGLESNLFDVMSCSSKKYSMETRNQLQYKNSVSIGNYSRTLGSVLYMYGMEKYFDSMMDVFIDGFLFPEFSDNVMENVFDGNNQTVQRILNSPEALLAWTITKDVYKDHPYETLGNVTPDSVNNITIEKMKDAHEQIIKDGDFFIVATGTMNSKKLIKMLNKTIGNIKFDSSKKYEMKRIPLVQVKKNKPVIVTHPSAAGTAMCARVFASPEVKNSDAIVSFIAGEIYSDVLYNVVREHYGICYTPYSSVTTSLAPISKDYLYKVSDYENVGKAVKEAIDYMSRGIVIEKTNEDGTYKFSTIEENLESYKSKWINSKYENSKTTSGQMFRIMTNIMYYKDIDYDLNEVELMKKITADDIIRVFNKYWVEGNSTWYAVTFPGNEKNLIFE